MARRHIGSVIVTLAAFLIPGALASAQPTASPLIDAVKAGDAETVRALIGLSADVNVAEVDGTTALHWAAHLDDGSTATLLLGAGADVGTTTRYGIAPLSLAATNGSAKLIRILLEAGADPNHTTGEGETPLMTTARAGVVAAIQLLLDHGAEIDAVEGWRGQTALMWAASQDNAAAVATLIAGGADLHAVSEGGFTPLLFAAREGNVETLGTLLEAGANPDDALPNGTSALGLATYNAQYEAAARLLEAGADADASGQGWTALHQVVWTRRPNLGRNPPFPVPLGRLDGLDMARILIEHGADPNLPQTKEPRDGNRNMLNRVGSTPFLLAAKAADVPMMRLLADMGADPSLTTENGATPMMAAAGVGIWKIGENPGTNEEALEAVALTWKLGNDVKTTDANGDTALHGAVHRGADEIVRFLHEKGAVLDAVNETGWTALSIAEGVFYPNTFNRHPSIVTLLESLGADPTAGNRRPIDLAPWEREALTANAPRP
ncbi:MAG: ankyrin repeat domain-containing protein [Vicinamibacterales bacterium]|nr:ankyrin repeat domain-containing protein [Vicinamibacterales bacterium]MDP7479065.1 ankyrin repeat domain-containing protein [Vicinamibacterales bacterium]MDP7692726.1 ankyrin repeat domain-containing protein [Vicinamibacterales bacterium]HJN46502.1 ankyrin repeat domain-containing protein [Vicinamibacterales bacterium]